MPSLLRYIDSCCWLGKSNVSQLILPRPILAGPIDTETIGRAQNVGAILGTEYLLLVPAPGWIVDAVDVVLDLEDNASVLGNDAGEVFFVEEALGALEGQSAILLRAAVDLESILVGEYIDADARPVRPQGRNGAVGAPVVRGLGAAVDDEAVVWTSFVSANRSRPVAPGKSGQDLP